MKKQGHREITWEVNEKGCHICTSHKPGSHGYPQIEINNKKRTINRVAFEKAYGPIPEKLQVCHTCDNRMCINPEHLFLGTINDNMKDMCKKGRHISGEEWGQGRRGEKNGRAKLTPKDITYIKFNTNGISQGNIAKMFNISPSQVQRIRSEKQWKHIKRVL